MGAHKWITLSFDDGVTQDRRLIELLDRYGLKATFNLNSGLLGQPGELEHDGKKVAHNKVAPEEIAELYRNHEVAVHTRTHPLLTALSEEEILDEVMSDKAELERLTGREVVGMAYPCGGTNYDGMVREVLEKETPIRYARTIISTNKFDAPKHFLEWHPTCHAIQANVFDLAEAFDRAEPEGDSLFYIWGHAYEFDIVSSDAWERLEQFCERLSRIEGAAFLTNREVYEAMTAR